MELQMRGRSMKTHSRNQHRVEERSTGDSGQALLDKKRHSRNQHRVGSWRGQQTRQYRIDKTRQNSSNTTFPQPAQSEEPERSFSTRQDKLNQPKGVHSYKAQVGLLLFFETPNERDDKDGTERAF